MSQEDRKRIAQLRLATRANTDAAAIREALRLATREMPATMAIGFEILQWAEKLAFTSKREQGELREFARRIYKLEAGD